jgi:uncharacterized membrane protein YedE/YeeE
MHLIVDPQSWLNAALGGLLIGIAASLILWLNGAIAGISGILGSLVLTHQPRDERVWRLAFIVGLPLGAALFAALNGGLAVHLQTGFGGMLIGGLLVGFGTRLGSGCTSGHGVCGLARRSRRSLAAVLVFMGAGMLTVFVIRTWGPAS